MEVEKRSSYFDNVKFVLIVLVVFSHLFQPFIEGNRMYEDIYFYLFTVHMPAFIFISGYFSKKNLQEGRWLKNSFHYLKLYIIFQYAYAFFYWLIGETDKMSFDLITPQWSLWFLVCMAFWQLGLRLFHWLKPVEGVVLSVVLCLVSGYLPFIGREFTLQRVFVFFPYYLVGYYCPTTVFSKFQKTWTKVIAVVGQVLSFVCISSFQHINKYWVFGSKAYEDFMAMPELGWSVRFIILLLSVIGIVGILCIVPTGVYWYTEIGKHTLTIYLFHGFVVKWLREGLDYPDITSPMLLVLLLVVSLLLVILIGNQYVSNFLGKITNSAKSK